MADDRLPVAPRETLEKGPFGIPKLSLRKYRVSARTIDKALWGASGKPKLPATERKPRGR